MDHSFANMSTKGAVDISVVPASGLDDTGDFGIDLIPSKYTAGIANTNTDTSTDTFHVKCHDHLFFVGVLSLSS